MVVRRSEQACNDGGVRAVQLHGTALVHRIEPAQPPNRVVH